MIGTLEGSHLALTYIAGVFTIPAAVLALALWRLLTERGMVLYCRCGKTFGNNLPSGKRRRASFDRATDLRHELHRRFGDHKQRMKERA